MKTQKTLLALALSLAATGAANTALADAISDGDFYADVNLRFESSDLDDPADNKTANALIADTAFGYESKDFSGFKVLAEYEVVNAIIDNYAPETAGYDVVADPEVREWNRAQLSYNKEGITATVGRQRIILDNARFVGNVGWRANEQTYDGASLKLVNGPVEFFFAYIDQVNSILPALDMDTNSKLFNLGYSTPIGKISGYGYLLDDQDRDIQTDTVGARFSGKAAMDTVSFTYTAEYAAQEKEANAGNNDAEYMALELGVEAKGATFAIGNETLGSDDGAYGFQTPLATKHAFNGWADMFLATPADGLSDTYIKVGGNAKGVKLLAVYHDFKADEGSNDYGTELDLLAVKKFGNYTVGAKYASYKAEDVKVDDDKVWLWVQTKF